MLDKARRLNKKKDYIKLATHGRPIHGPYCALRIRKQSDLKSLVGFITSTKAMKLAFDRNRVKRRMRAIIHEIWKDIPNSVHLLFILKPIITDVEYPVLREEIRRMIKKIPFALEKPAKFSSRGVKYTKKHENPPTSHT